MSDQDEFRINWINVVGSALGAVSGAVLLSTLGAAGTLVGAALSSACITVGGAFYAHSMRVTKRRLATTHRVPIHDQIPVRDSARAPVGSQRVEATDEAPAATQPPWGPTLRELPWKRIGMATAGLFVLAMAVILAFELSTGRPVSSYTGGSSDSRTGTSVPGVGGGGGTGDGAGADTPSPAPSEQGPASRPSAPEQPGTSPAPEPPSSAPSEQVPSSSVPSLPAPPPPTP